MRARVKVQPQLESLESMTLLSGTAAAAVHHQVHTEVATTPARGAALTLSGTVRGAFVVTPAMDAKVYNIDAAGSLTPIGKTTVTGYLHVITGISMGPPNGTLHLFTKKGSLTLQIPKSVMIPAGVPNPTSPNEIVDTYVISGGTGAYKRDKGSGVVEFTFNSVGSSAAPSPVGMVNVTFTSLETPTPTAATT